MSSATVAHPLSGVRNACLSVIWFLLKVVVILVGAVGVIASGVFLALDAVARAVARQRRPRSSDR